MLSACANNAPTETVEAPAVNQTTVQTTPISSTTSSAKEEKSTESSTTTTSTASESKTTSKSSRATKADSIMKGSASQAVTSQTEASVSDKTGSSSITSASVSERKPKVTTVSSAPKNDVTQGTTTTTLPKSTTKKQSSTTTTTAKPRQSSSTTTTTTVKPKSTTTTTKSLEDQYLEELWEIIERKGLQGQDATCLETMVLNLKYSDTPPSYYESVGWELKHDGTDYGKAVAVYKWMRKNGWGSCVYYAMETYFVCKGIGLECAYGFATNNNWYGHTYSVVKVEGTWYVMDTQGRSFLDNGEPCTRMFDGNDNDLQPFERWIWYDYDENGDYRDWSISD